MPRVSKWTLGAVVTVVAALGMLFAGIATAGAGNAHGGVSVTVTPSVLSIVVTDPGVAFGFGVTPVNTTVSAIDGKTVTNNGSVAWTSLSGSYVNTPAASCVGGTNWTASILLSPESPIPATNSFVMNIDSDAVDEISAGAGFDVPGVLVPGGGGLSGDITGGNVAAGTDVDVDFELVMPVTVTTGANVCTIALTLTAVAA